jgi:hypothetical protein
MKKLATFLIVSVMLYSQVWSQVNVKTAEEAKYQLQTASKNLTSKQVLPNLNKAPGDTLWYEDFGNGFSTNQWTSSGSTPWIYTTQAPGGQYSNNTLPIQSTTTINGFASLRSDFYNTPTPPGGFSIISEYLSSGSITIPSKSSVLVRWQQAFRYCCSAATSIMELQVSVDNINWTSFDVKGVVGPNSLVNIELKEVDISAIASNQTTIYLRFYNDVSHYYWMVDDIALVEGVGSSSNGITIPQTYLYNYPNQGGSYTMIPCAASQSLYPAALVKNESSAPATNLQLKSALVSGANVYYTGASNSVSQLNPNEDSILSMQNPINGQLPQGDYGVVYKTSSDLLSQNINSASYQFSITDTVYARDYGQSTAGVGPGSFVGGNVNGSRIALAYDLFNTETLSSISFYISRDSLNVGASVKVSVRSFDTSASNLNGAFANVVAQNPIPYIIQSTDLGSWVSIPLLPSTAVSAGKYIAVVEQSDGFQNNRELRLGRDVAAETHQSFNKDLISFIYANGGFIPNWGFITSMPMIRLNVKNLSTSGICSPVGIEEANLNAEIQAYPNPTNGQFVIDLPLNGAIQSIAIYGIDGRIVVQKNTPNVNSNINFDLSDYPKGLYFIRMSSNKGVATKKIILQ